MKVHNKAKLRLYKAQKQKEKEEENLQQQVTNPMIQVKQLKNMESQIYNKASDIMHGRNASTYYRKVPENVVNDAQGLKKLKISTSEGCLRKLESTRKIMQNKSARVK